MATSLPSHFRKVVVTRLSADFREATEIRQAAMPGALSGWQALVRISCVGINASDINFANGKYLPGVKPPFDAGFEALGTVVRVRQQAEARFIA